MSLIQRVKELNRSLPNREYYRYFVNNCAVGYIDTQILPELCTSLFHIDPQKKAVHSSFAKNERLQFEKNIEQFFKEYFRKHNLLKSWRNECYAVKESFESETLFIVERAALSFLGITGYGVHINGYVEKADGMYMWVAKRSQNKPTAPGKLDQIAAGGVPYNVSLMENVIKECEEEAHIPRELAETAEFVSRISCSHDLDIGIRPDTMFIYDLKLPESFIPQVNDGEVESFSLMPIDEILTILENTQDFKFNSAVVVIDFAIRHNLITRNYPHFQDIIQELNKLYY